MSAAIRAVFWQQCPACPIPIEPDDWICISEYPDLAEAWVHRGCSQQPSTSYGRRAVGSCENGLAHPDGSGGASVVWAADLYSGGGWVCCRCAPFARPSFA